MDSTPRFAKRAMLASCLFPYLTRRTKAKSNQIIPSILARSTHLQIHLYQQTTKKSNLDLVHTESESNTHLKYGSSAKAVWMISMAPGISDFDSGTTSMAMMGHRLRFLATWNGGDKGRTNRWIWVSMEAWELSICKYGTQKIEALSVPLCHGRWLV